MARMVLGIFSQREGAESAINSLEDQGFSPKDISILMQDGAVAREISDNTGANVAEGAISGATTGGAIGAIAGLLVGIGAIAIPGLGAVLIGGPLAAALGLTGAAATTVSGAATGALAGGLIGALVSLGIPEEDARYYEEGIRSGGILVAVPTVAGEDLEVQDLLVANGATQVRSLEISDQNWSTSRRTSRMDEGDYHRPAAYAESAKSRKK